MTVSNGVMAGAGAMVLISVLLSMTVSGNFMWLTIFVGVMMLQSAFTGFCPMAMILKKLGFK
ncbi:MAG TPA: DUF2892 domain-containing protein [Leucothrix mucor]|uniref:DUF2892 domain-containing protein n=1 Tax=Leucothrix mucor TaxID=45248 RepID=A0A7V2T282_LEUMU|nr:DUF2892 domain-containing protein [Leucothrix mucor]